MNVFDKVLDQLTDRERMRSVLMFVFFIDVLVTTLLTMWAPTVDRVIMMFGMYMMLLVPILVLYKDRRSAPQEEKKVEA